jgi:hypothetical protein
MPVTAVSDVAPGGTGLASALLNTGQQLGGALGLSGTGHRGHRCHHDQSPGSQPNGRGHAAGLTHLIATAAGYTIALEVAAGIALAGLVISVTVIRVPRTPVSSEPAPAVPTAAGAAA